jgi:hypothetical protein
MAIVVLVLWLFTAGAGFSVLITSNLKGARVVSEPQLVPADARPAAQGLPAQGLPAQGLPAQGLPAQGPAAQGPAPAAPVKDRFAPPSLVAARNAPVVPGARALLEFAHPASGIIGLAFWLGFALVHNRVLGWIGFGLATATACAGLAWFTVNVRAAHHRDRGPADPQHPADPAPSFRGRLVALHGAGATLTVVLAALTALVLRG